MTENTRSQLSEICGALAAHRLPRWQDLPDLELYMDQVLALVDRYLGSYPGFDGKGLTASMVNNYVKLGVMPPPVRKKYTRTHLAHLLMICVLKASLPIASIQRLIACELENSTEDLMYDRFCALFEQTGCAVASSAESLLDSQDDSPSLLPSLYYSALRAQAERALALKLHAALFPEDADA